MIVSNLLQVIIGIVLVFILLFIAYLIYNYESIISIRNASSLKKEIIMFDGIMNFSSASWGYNTFNKSSASYRDLTPSINQNGGAEYTYSFWLSIDKSSPITSTEDLVLLLRGSKIRMPYINDTNCKLSDTGSYVLVKNPMIRMKNDASAIVIEYNTLTNPDAYREYGNTSIDCTTNSWFDKNRGLLGIYNLDTYVSDKKWFMFTVVLKEITPENDILYKNKTSCRIYINGISVYDKTVESPYNSSYGSAAMKHNRGPLFVNPGNVIDGDGKTNPFARTDGKSYVKMANLHYFNYALTELEVMQLFQKGFKKASAVHIDDRNTIYSGDEYEIVPLTENNDIQSM